VRLRRERAADVEPREFIDGANESFGAWGDAAFFAWAFRGDAEILFLDDDAGRTIAASGITYRTVRYASGDEQLAAILTGSWTRADARGRGAFTQLVEATNERARERDAIVLGFGRMENASRRRIEAAGATIHRAAYARGTMPMTAALDVLDPDPSLFARRSGSTFIYMPDEWRAQFIERPHANIECVGRDGEWAAIVERANEFDRVHAISDFAKLPLLARGRPLFCYTTIEAEMQSLTALGFELTDGFLPVHPASAISNWNLENGDRM
jgi:GNAT superfamily N-acetyltransferase